MRRGSEEGREEGSEEVGLLGIPPHTAGILLLFTSSYSFFSSMSSLSDSMSS